MHGQKGAAMVEFAIVLPFLMLLLFGSVELGRFAYYAILVADAARAGAQYGSQNLQTADDPTGMAAAAEADLGTAAQSTISNLSVTGEAECLCWDGSSYSDSSSTDCSASTITCTTGTLTYLVQVTVSGTVDSLLHFPNLPTSLTISQVATQRVVKTF